MNSRNVLISHLLKNNLDEILRRSLLNCHVPGLHSIVFLESPGKTIRMFIADKDHELYKNEPPFDRLERKDPMSLAFHSHHCNITIEMVQGSMTNYTITAGQGGLDTFELYAYQYISKINNGKGGFERRYIPIVKPIFEIESSIQLSNPNDYGISSLYLRAHELHTVYVDRGRTAAWFVYEGLESADYQEECYSNDPNLEEDWTDEGLYQPMEKKDLIRLLTQAELIL